MKFSPIMTLSALSDKVTANEAASNSTVTKAASQGTKFFISKPNKNLVEWAVKI